MKQPVKWLGKVRCDFCQETESEFWYDAKTTFGPWAFMCQSCFETSTNNRLDQGRGQRYDGQTLVKVEG